MPRASNRLSVRSVASLATPGLHADGGGLYLHVTASGARSWIYRFKRQGRARDMGLGSLADVGLAEARDLAVDCRRIVRTGGDPIEVRHARRMEMHLTAASTMTFRQCAEAYIAAHKAGWRNAVHAKQWLATLDQYVYPVIGKLSVQAVEVGLVLKCLQPIWTTKTETASRVRGRIEVVLDWATARGYRRGENPARWRGHLENLLPKKSRVKRVEHLAAMPYTEMGAFMAELRAQDGVAARALDFAILTAARRSEVIGARWDEIDADARMWTIPGIRTKAGREHRVPLSAAAMHIVNTMVTIRDGDYLFPGGKAKRPISGVSVLMTLRRMGRDGVTVHGFRSTFRDWCAERSTFPHEVAEMALGHAVADAVERAYRRGDLFEKRRQLAEAWAKYCAVPQEGGRVVPMRGAAAK